MICNSERGKQDEQAGRVSKTMVQACNLVVVVERENWKEILRPTYSEHCEWLGGDNGHVTTQSIGSIGIFTLVNGILYCYCVWCCATHCC